MALISLAKLRKPIKNSSKEKISNYDIKIDMSSFKCEVLSKELNNRWSPVLLINL